MNGDVITFGLEASFEIVFRSASGENLSKACSPASGASATLMSSEEICAVSWVPLTKFVVWLLPFHCTVELEIRLEPFTVKVKDGPPRVALVGLMVAIVGAGFVCGPEEPPRPAREIKARTQQEGIVLRT